MKVFLAIFVLFLLSSTAFPADPIHSDETFESTITKANELFLDAEFDKGIALIRNLEKTRPNSPGVSYFLANGYWWKIFREYIYDSESKETEFDDDFESYIQKTIDQSEELLSDNKRDIVALFYLGNAYSLKSRVKGLRNSYFSAGRDAAKGKNYLEQVLKYQPNQYDAYYNIGFYNYLAGALPGYAKVLKTLFFLPGGSKEKGLNYLNIASKKSTFFGAEAQLILARFYADFENRPQEAAQIVQRFHEKYPQNGWYHYWLGTLYSDEINDYDGAGKIYTEILKRCEKGVPSYTMELRNQAWLKLARVDTKQLYPEHAIEKINALIAQKPKEPAWILSRAYMELGNTYDQIGMRKEAIAAYTQVLSLRDYRNFHEQAQKLRTQSYDQTQANIYRLNLEGRRLAVNGKFNEAESSFRVVLKHYPNNDQTNYYLAELYYLKGNYKDAESLLQALIRKNPKEPKWMTAGLYVKMGKIYEATKQAAAAKRSYEKALDTKFIASDDRHTAQQGLRHLAQGNN
jgi:tetratricopeptide (TPR) repeat protein